MRTTETGKDEADAGSRRIVAPFVAARHRTVRPAAVRTSARRRV